MKRVQLIWAHPRKNSLTANIVQNISEELTQHGCSVKELDLYRSEFDPVLQTIDEPDWSNPNKKYSNIVMKLAAEQIGMDAVFIVFPIWWYSTPAILKGYIDRVWNHGIAYGKGSHLPFDSIRWIALAGESEDSLTKRGLDKTIIQLLDVGISGFCGIKDSQTHILYDTLGEKVTDLGIHHKTLIKQARYIAETWIKNKGAS